MTAQTELLAALIASLRNEPEEWNWGNADHYHIRHSSGVRVWVSSGCAHAWEPAIHFGFWGKMRLRAAFRHWRRVHGTAIAYRAAQQAIIDTLVRLTGVTRLRRAA